MAEPHIEVDLNTNIAIVVNVDTVEEATAMLNKELADSKKLTGGLQCVHSDVRSRGDIHVFDLQQYCEHLMGKESYCLVCGVDIGFVA